MSGIILREEDTEHIEVAHSSSPYIVTITAVEEGDEVCVCTSTIPALIVALAALWRETNPEDTAPEHDYWLRNGVPTLEPSLNPRNGGVRP